MRLTHISLILVVLLFSQSSEVLAGKGMDFILSFDKSEYKKSDQISANFQLKNNSKEPLYVNKRFYLNSEDSAKEDREVYLSVISPEGKELPCNVSSETGLPKSDYFVLLKPDEEVSIDRSRPIKHYFDFSAPGVYKITAVYQNIYGAEIGLDTFRDKIESNAVKIKIVE